jgi:hypothetical protein
MLMLRWIGKLPLRRKSSRLETLGFLLSVPV